MRNSRRSRSNRLYNRHPRADEARAKAIDRLISQLTPWERDEEYLKRLLEATCKSPEDIEGLFRYWPQTGRKLVIKAQVSLFSTSGGDTVLLYDESREFMTELPLSPDMKTFMEGRVKAYFQGLLIPDSAAGPGEYKMLLSAPVEDQPW